MRPGFADGGGPANRPSRRGAFVPRLCASTAVAHWAMRPAAVAGSMPLLRCFPGLLTWGARLSGKATRVVLHPRVDGEQAIRPPKGQRIAGLPPPADGVVKVMLRRGRDLVLDLR